MTIDLLKWLITLNISLTVGCLEYSSTVRVWPFVWQFGISSTDFGEVSMKALHLGPLSLINSLPKNH